MRSSVRETKNIYRDACGRSHRILGAYLALWAWKKGADFVVLDRDQTFKYLGLGAMRERRLRWLEEDIKDFFPFQEALHSSRSGGHMSLYLSRKEFSGDAFSRTMTDEKRIKLLTEQGVRASVVGRVPSEQRMITMLATAATGGGRPKFLRRKTNALEELRRRLASAGP